MPNNQYIELHDLEDANDYLKKTLNVKENFSFIEEGYSNVNSVFVGTYNEKSVVGFIQHDSSPTDFFDDDGVGNIITFKSYEDYKTKIKELDKSKKLYYLLDKYEHGNIHISVTNTMTYPDSRWDVSEKYAAYVPDEYIQKEYKKLKKQTNEEHAKKHFIKDTNSILNTYSDWCNGEVYGYTLLKYENGPENPEFEQVWGYIGYKNTEDELKSYIKDSLQNYVVKEYEKGVVIEEYTDIKDIKKIPFKVPTENLEKFEIAKVYDKTIIALNYKDTSSIYIKSEGSRKVQKVNYGELQKIYNISPEEFSKKRMKAEIRECIKKHLLNEQSTNKKTINP